MNCHLRFNQVILCTFHRHINYSIKNTYFNKGFQILELFFTGTLKRYSLLYEKFSLNGSVSLEYLNKNKNVNINQSGFWGRNEFYALA